MVGARVRLDYYDQNERFASNLPRTGQIVLRCATHAVDDWFLVDLDERIELQLCIDPGKHRYRLGVFPRVLIRSRWEGRPIGGPEPPSVFLLLVEEGMAVPERDLAIEQFM